MLVSFLVLFAGAAMLSQTHAETYTVHRVETLPAPTAAWDAQEWAAAETLTIARFHPLGTDHRPRTQCRILHDGRAIAVMFRVEDRHVVARHTQYQSPTHQDSCVELFVKPRPDRGYFNFEFNAIGTLLLWYVEKPRGPDGQFQKYTEVPANLAKQIAVHTSLRDPILAELEGPITWTVSHRIPLDVIEEFTGPIGDLSGQTWTGNVYKCADASSHPHWGYWSDVGEKLDFHQPDKFGRLVLE